MRYQQDQNDGPSKAERDRLEREAERMRDPVLRARKWRALFRSDKWTVKQICENDGFSPLVVARSIVALIDSDASDHNASERDRARLEEERCEVLAHMGDEKAAARLLKIQEARMARFLAATGRSRDGTPQKATTRQGPSLASILGALASNPIAS
jgi:hypothetical protein